MLLWKVELFLNREDQHPTRWGVMVAHTKSDAHQKVSDNMGDAKRADYERVLVSEIRSLPEGTFFWSDNNKKT